MATGITQETFFSMHDVVATKLSPQHRKGHIQRVGLNHKIKEILACRLTVVHAAPGYGKSSLLSQWLNQLNEQNIRTAWLTLEEEESSASAFLIHVITACIKSGYLDESVLSNIGRVDDKVSLKVLMTIFINALVENTSSLVIFFDEYNRIQSDDIDNFLRVMLRNVPPHVHFVVASRWRPHLDLENLRVHNDLLEITANDLRFSSDEAATLMQLALSTEQMKEVQRFLEYTEGWPMALQMLKLWLSGSRQRVDFIADFIEKNAADMARYLTEQVLSDLPEEQQDFLVYTSILERVNGDIANAITGRTDSWLVLEKLYERNLFLEPLETQRQWFNFHTVFLEYLRDMLKKRHSDIITKLHERAAKWFEQQGDIRRAVFHAQQTQDNVFAAAIIDRAGGWRMVMDGRIELIRKSLENIAESVIETLPKLLLARILLLVKNGHIDDAFGYFKSLNLCQGGLWSEQDIIDYKVIENTLSDYADDRISLEEIDAIENLKNQIPRQDHLLQALLSDSLASKCYGMRLFKQTHAACENAASHYRILQSLYGEMFIRFKQVQVYFAQGKLDEAEAILSQNEKEIDIRLGENTDLAAHNRIFLAELLLEKSDIQQAELMLSDALPLIEQADGWFELYASAYSSAASLAWQRAGIEDVLVIAERARAVAKSRHLARLDIVADCELVFYLCLESRHDEALPIVRTLENILQNETQPFHFMVGHIAICLGIFYVSGFEYSKVEQVTETHRIASQEFGDVRQSIELNIVASIGKFANRQTHEAAQLFDQALQKGLFRGFKQTYIKYTYWLLPLVNLLVKNDEMLPADRYRTSFLVELKRGMNEWEQIRLKDENALTIGEQEVLKEIVQGYSNKKIAQLLGISPNTVKYRLKGIFNKYGVSKRNDLAQLVRRDSTQS